MICDINLPWKSNVNVLSGKSSFIDKELKKSPQLVVFFTDGYDNPPKYRPKWARNLVWVIYDNNSYEGPYGQTIHVSKDDMKK